MNMIDFRNERFTVVYNQTIKLQGEVIMLRFLLLSITSIFLLSGCDSDPKKEQVYQLAVLYENYAWGTQRQGLYLTVDGELFSYINNEKIEDYDSVVVGKTYSESYLNNLISDSEHLLEAIDSSVHNNLITKTKDVEKAQISESTYECTDAGQLLFVSFEFNSNTGDYTPILLEQRGDLAAINLSDSAKFLVEWLDIKLKEYQMASLDYCVSPHN